MSGQKKSGEDTTVVRMLSQLSAGGRSEIGVATYNNDETPAVSGAGLPPAGETRGRETILLLEDEQQVLEIIETMLKRKGYRVVTANNGKAAVSESRHARGSIDLLIADVGIPDMNGREVWEAVKHQHPNSRVLFISGYPEEFLPLQDLGDGKKVFLQKPFDSASLLKRIREIINPGD